MLQEVLTDVRMGDGRRADDDGVELRPPHHRLIRIVALAAQAFRQSPGRILANVRDGHDPAALAVLERLGVRLGDAPCPHQAESDLVIHHGGYLVSCSTASLTESAM